jgi:hypothetical protein
VLQTLKDHTIRTLHLTVTLRVWHQSIINIDARVCSKVLKLPQSEQSPIIIGNVVGNTKPIHDLLDEFHRHSLRHNVVFD